MLFEILKNLRNFFPDLDNQISGQFEVEEGAIVPFPTLLDGQYFLIEGSALNDGVWNATTGLKNESFVGTITPLKIPRDLLDLATEIETYQASVTPSQFTSESFGGYSYTKATNASGNVAGWQEVFASRLKAWRKL